MISGSMNHNFLRGVGGGQGPTPQRALLKNVMVHPIGYVFMELRKTENKAITITSHDKYKKESDLYCFTIYYNFQKL